MRYIAMCLRQALHKKFPESDEDDVLKVSTRTTCTLHVTLHVHVSLSFFLIPSLPQFSVSHFFTLHVHVYVF